MYAVIETGGKQYRVEVGTELEVEYLDVQPGDAITLDRVLLVADGGEASIGQPVVADAIVRAEVLRQDRGEKVISFKYRPKARSRVKKGHRQELTVLRVTDVRLGDRSAAEEVQAAQADAATERERLEEAAARQAAADAALAAQLAASRPAETPSSTTVRRRGAGKAEAVDESTEPATESADAAPKRTRASKAKATDATTDATTAADATTTADATATADAATATTADEPTGGPDETSTDAPTSSDAETGEDQ